VKEVRGEVLGTHFVMLRPDRCVVAKELYWGRGHRPRPEDDMAVEVFAKLAPRSNVVLDIGAYTGLFTLVATSVNPDLHVHAFEIVPDVYKALFDNCVRNDVLVRTTLHHEGIGRPGQMVTMPVDSVESALPDFFSSDLIFDTGAQVRLRSLDSLLPMLPENPRVLMKIDVEGTEHEVLRFGRQFLRTCRPDMLCEVLHGRAEGPELERLLPDYRFYLVEADGLHTRPHLQPSAQYRDWLFTLKSAEALRGEGVPVIT
jgi:FkbM family methyltransferase